LLGLLFDPEDGSDMFLLNVEGLCFPPTFTLISYFAYSSNLTVEAAYSSETSVDFPEVITL
jgi:hypothetical protein